MLGYKRFSLLKPDGSARPLHDGTHGVQVNNNIRLLNQQSNPGPKEVVHLVRSAKQSQEATFCIAGDVTAAHRLFLVREADWPLLCCKVRSDSPVVWYNKVGTFGISSSAFLWSRFVRDHRPWHSSLSLDTLVLPPSLRG